MRKPIEIGDKIKFVGSVNGVPSCTMFASLKNPMLATVTGKLGNGGGEEGLLVEFNWGRKTLDKGVIHRRQVTHRLIPRKKPLALPITREMLEAAFREYCVIPPESALFQCICGKLGFPAQEKGKRDE